MKTHESQTTVKERIISAYEPEDLPGAIREGLGVKGVWIKKPTPDPLTRNPMVELVAKAIEERR